MLKECFIFYVHLFGSACKLLKKFYVLKNALMFSWYSIVPRIVRAIKYPELFFTLKKNSPFSSFF